MFARTMPEQQRHAMDGDGRPKGRNRQSPLSELAERLAIRLRNSEYEPTKEEFEAVSKCKNEVLVNTIKYPLFFGVVAGGVSYRMQVLARAFSIAVASALGLEFGRQKAEYKCIKHFMALEGSPIKSVLVDILQKDFPDHPLLREGALNRSSHVEGDEHNFFSEGKEIGFSGLNTIVDSPPQYGPDDREGQGGGRSKNVMNRREVRIGRRQAPDARDSDNSDAMGRAADILVDPFSSSLWTDVDDTGDANKEKNQGTSRRELRRSRMTSEQKREHNRRLREQREQRGQQQHRQANGM